jgi:uncharacterized protein (DUF2141 family)
MKKKAIKSTVLGIAFVMLGFSSFSQSNPKTPFTIKITNVKNPSATIHIGFYKKGNNFPTQQQHAFAKEFIPGKTGEASITWDDVPEGEYSLAIYQDLDNSGRMKANMFGYPKEPFAFSNNFKPKMSKPKFDQCKIIFNSSNNTFEVKLID